MSTEIEFKDWFNGWINRLPEEQRSGEWVASQLNVSEATVSGWRNGRNPPKAEYIAPLARMTGESLEYVANLAYKEFGWNLGPTTDPLMKEPLIREGLRLLRGLFQMAPELAAAALQVLQSLDKIARRQKSN